MFTKTVQLNEENISKLTTLYKQAYAQIVAEIETASNFGVANRKAILSQVQEILLELGSEINDITTEEIGKYYAEGQAEAGTQLKKVGAEVAVDTQFNKIHKEAVLALVDDTQRAFAESIQGVNRSATRLLGKAVREQITQQLALGKITGETLRHIKQNIVGILREEGLAALIDKGGRPWELDRYAEMLIRTKAVEARNRGLVNRFAENEYDLVQVSAHGADDVCGDWEGKILSVTGNTSDYPTVDEAEADGLFHPNCRHAINALTPELAGITNAYNPNIDTLTGDEFIDEVDTDLKGLAKPPRQEIDTKTPAR